jgi:hypothetical protein
VVNVLVDRDQKGRRILITHSGCKYWVVSFRPRPHYLQKRAVGTRWIGLIRAQDHIRGGAIFWLRQKYVIQSVIFFGCDRSMLSKAWFFLVATEVCYPKRDYFGCDRSMLSKTWFFWLRQKYAIQSVIILVATEVCYPKRDYFGCDRSMLSKAWLFWLRHKYAIQNLIFLVATEVCYPKRDYFCCDTSMLPKALGHSSVCVIHMYTSVHAHLSHTYVLVNLSNSELINTYTFECCYAINTNTYYSYPYWLQLWGGIVQSVPCNWDHFLIYCDLQLSCNNSRFIHQSSLLRSQQRHTVAKQGETWRGMAAEFCLSVSLSYLRDL